MAERILDQLPAERPGTPAPASLMQRRAAIEAQAVEIEGPPAAGARSNPLLWVGEGASPALYLHGGGYRMGSARSSAGFAARLAASTGRRIAVADYRLAPEHPFPAALRDVVDVYEGIATASGPPVVIGDSAGGGLALALAIALRDGGRPPPAGIAVISPWVDLKVTAASYRDRADLDRYFSAEAASDAAAAYLAGLPAHTPLASPLHADLTGLPPVQIHVGTDEVLLDDSLRLTAALASAGGAVDLHVVPGMSHVFPIVEPEAPASRAALDRIGSWADALEPCGP